MKQRSTTARASAAEPEPSQAGGKLYSRGLKSLEKTRLIEIASRFEGIDATRNSASIAGQIGERLADGRTLAFQIQSLSQSTGPRLRCSRGLNARTGRFMPGSGRPAFSAPIPLALFRNSPKRGWRRA